MNTTNTYENFFKPFMNTDYFKVEDFQKNLAEGQKAFFSQFESAYKLAEENNKKIKAYFDEQLKAFNNDAFTSQVEKFMKTSEDHAKAVHQYFEKNSFLDQDGLMEKVQSFMKVVEENNTKTFKLFQNNLKSATITK